MYTVSALNPHYVLITHLCICPIMPSDLNLCASDEKLDKKSNKKTFIMCNAFSLLRKMSV